MSIRPRASGIPPTVPAGASFAFGKSPFRVKGVLYQGTQGFFEQNVRGGLGALADEIAEPELREFITQSFLASGWYDVMPVPALIAYEARALRMGLEEYLLHRTRYQAKRDLGGVYSWILKLATPALVGSRLPKIMGQMFDFVRVETQRVEDDAFEVLFHGIPLPLEHWLHVCLGVYAETAMKLAGARSVDVAPPRPRAEGEIEGVRVATLEFALRWA